MQHFSILKIFTLILVCSSCKVRSTTSGSKLDSLLLEDKNRNTSLVKKIKNPSLNFCLIQNDKISPKTISENKDQIERAFDSWLKPVQEFTKSQFWPTINWTIQNQDDCLLNESIDLIIEFDKINTGRAHFITEKHYIKIFSEDTYGVLLHEMGHAMGLDDTYLENSLSCKPGHPIAVMCGAFKPRDIIDPIELTSDDIFGVKASFCREYANDYSSCVEYPVPTAKPSLLPDGRSVFTLGMEVAQDLENCPENTVKITNFIVANAAQKWGLKQGYCVGSINETKIKTSEEFRNLESMLHTSMADIWYTKGKKDGYQQLYVLAERRVPPPAKPSKRGDFVMSPLPLSLYDSQTKALISNDKLKANMPVIVLRSEGEWTRIRIGYAAYWVKSIGLTAIDLNE